MNVDLSTTIAGIKLKNPVLAASGTFGYGYEIKDLVDLRAVGAIITKTVTLLPREGNPPPRLAETASGILNTIGLQINGSMMSVDPIRTHMVFSTTDANLNAAFVEQTAMAMDVSAVKRSLNVQLNYSIGKFGLNVVSNYTGYVLKSGTGNGTVSGNGAIIMKTIRYSNASTNSYYNEAQYQAPRCTVDARIDYKINPRYTLYFQARNVLGRPIVISTQFMPFNHAEYGDPIFELGLRGSF